MPWGNADGGGVDGKHVAGCNDALVFVGWVDGRFVVSAGATPADTDGAAGGRCWRFCCCSRAAVAISLAVSTSCVMEPRGAEPFYITDVVNGMKCMEKDRETSDEARPWKIVAIDHSRTYAAVPTS